MPLLTRLNTGIGAVPPAGIPVVSIMKYFSTPLSISNGVSERSGNPGSMLAVGAVTFADVMPCESAKSSAVGIVYDDALADTPPFCTGISAIITAVASISPAIVHLALFLR